MCNRLCELYPTDTTHLESKLLTKIANSDLVSLPSACDYV